MLCRSPDARAPEIIFPGVKTCQREGLPTQTGNTVLAEVGGESQNSIWTLLLNMIFNMKEQVEILVYHIIKV